MKADVYMDIALSHFNRILDKNYWTHPSGIKKWIQMFCPAVLSREQLRDEYDLFSDLIKKREVFPLVYIP